MDHSDINYDKGFSVIELCLSLGLLALGLGSYLSFSTMSQKHQLRQFLNSLGQAIHTASALAIRSGSPCQIHLSEQTKRVSTECRNSTLLIKPLIIPNVIEFISTTSGKNHLVTYESGTFSPGTIEVQRNSMVCKLSLSLYGSQTISCL